MNAWPPSITMTVVIVIAMLFVTPDGSTAQSIPSLATWVSHMTVFGGKHCATLKTIKDGPIDPALAATYYDAERVFYQIADYTRSATWKSCAATAEYIYRDRYVIPNAANVPGYWNFTTGLTIDALRTVDPRSRQWAIALSKTGYARDGVPLAWTASTQRSREVAYAILSYINAQALGEPRRARRSLLVDQAYDHMEQWFVTKTWQGTTHQFAPFMVGLTAHALIRDWEQTHDVRLRPALMQAAYYLWQNAWVSTNQSMRYELNPSAAGGTSTTGAPDLNLVIAPFYAWLWWQTGNPTYRDHGDQLFAGGVTRAWLDGPKQFNQNYWWSFDYVRWRQQR
jgi:hypothetical protein